MILNPYDKRRIQIIFRNPLYFAEIPRLAWAYLDCLSPIGVVYFIEAHAIDKIYLSTFTNFESTQLLPESYVRSHKFTLNFLSLFNKARYMDELT